VLDLYDPDRSKTPVYLGELSTWENVPIGGAGACDSQKAVSGAGLRILTGTIISPTLTAQIEAVQNFIRRQSGISGSRRSAMERAKARSWRSARGEYGLPAG